MSEQVCKADMGGDGAAVVDANGYPVETTGNAVLDILEHRSSTRAFARDDNDRPVAVTDEQRAAMDVLDTTIRISVGLEDMDDIIEDFRQAL